MIAVVMKYKVRFQSHISVRVEGGGYVGVGDYLVATRVPGTSRYRIIKLNGIGEFESWVGDFWAREVNYIAGQLILPGGVSFGELSSLPM
jgi:hypothetical protein